MTLYAPLHEQNLSYSATLDRQLIDVVFARAGIVSVNDLAVSQRGAGANMSVDVAAGRCVVTGTDAAGQGKYLCWSDAVTNVTIATAPGTGLSRIDLIVAQVRDADQNGGANNDWIITKITGTAASSPSAPSAPPSSYVLAQVAVAANVTSIVTANITDKRSIVTPSASGTILASSTGTTSWTATVGSYTTINSALAVTVVAPPSGKVKLTFQALLNNGAAGVRAQFQWSVTGGSGPGTWRTGNIDYSGHEFFTGLWTGLTPGTSYTATLQWAYYNTPGALTLGDGTDQWLILAEGA